MTRGSHSLSNTRFTDVETEALKRELAQRQLYQFLAESDDELWLSRYRMGANSTLHYQRMPLALTYDHEIHWSTVFEQTLLSQS